MTTLLRFPIGFVRKACLVVVGGVAIGKAVGHQIEHYICTAKTLTLSRIFFARLKFVANNCAVLPLTQFDV